MSLAAPPVVEPEQVSLDPRVRVVYRSQVLRLGIAFAAILSFSPRADAAPACSDGPACLAEGNKVEPKDARAAFDFYDRGCHLKHELSCAAAAFMQKEGKLGKPDLERSHQYFVMGCGDNFEGVLSCAMVGLDLLRDIGGTGDHAKNVRLGGLALMKSCTGGSSFGCYNWGIVLRDGVAAPADLKAAYVAFTAACKGGEATGCREQGIALLSGAGVAKAPAQAIALFEKACSASAVECFELGHAYSQGTGVKADLRRARAYYTKACDAGDGTSCYNLALMIAGAKGGPADSPEAHRRLAQACKGGVQRACD
jgi:hypothetical protein